MHDKTKPLTKEQAQALFLEGQHVILAEYRMSIAETINWRDKVSHAPMSAPALRHTVETASGAITVNERLPDETDVSKYISPFKKGSKVVLWLSELTTVKGVTSARGQIQPLQG